MTQWEKEMALETKLINEGEMMETKQAILDGKIYARVDSVSRSGMSRRISFFRIIIGNKEEKTRIANVTHHIAWLIGDVKIGEYKQGTKWLREEGLKVDGCGMDMIFHTLYNCLTVEESRTWNQRYSVL